MMLKIQARLALLLGLIVVIFGTALVLLQRLEQERAALLWTDKRQEKIHLLNKMIELNGTTERTFVYDYSFWDDMMKFIHSADSDWAYSNIDIGLGTFNATAAWIFDTSCHLLYSTAKEELLAEKTDPDLLSLICQPLQGISFPHYFIGGKSGIIEIWSAPIQPGLDNTRITPPHGYFVAGRLWDKTYIDELALLTKCSMKVETAAEFDSKNPLQTANSSSQEIVLTRPLLGSDKRPIAYLDCRYKSSAYKEMIHASRRQMLLLGLFSAVVFILLTTTLVTWVSRPLSQISQSLASNGAKRLDHLSKGTTEFGQIAQLIDKFFEQKVKLEEEIKERTQVAAALQESQRALETLLSNLPGMAYRCRNNIDRAMDFVSEGCFGLTGYSPQDMIGNAQLPYRQLIFPEDLEKTWETIQFALNQRKPYRLQYRIIDAYHIQRWVYEHGGGVFSPDGKLLALEGFITDVTEMVRAQEQEVSLKEKLERARRMESLGALAGGVAHDLNNILGPLVAYPEMIIEQLPEDSPLNLQLKKTSRAARAAVMVIQDLLTLARRGRYEMIPTNLNRAIQDYLESPNYERLLMEHSNVKVEINLDQALPLIMGSASHLSKVIMNLIINAAEAMPEGGQLNITTSSAYLEKPLGHYGKFQPGNYVFIKVLDTGIGIDPQDFNKIFEPYYSKKKAGQSGSGLGLSVVYGVVKDHKGHYDVFSEIGKGTEFILYFPIVDAQILIQATEHLDCRGQETILVVDDVQIQLDLSTDILTPLGYQVVVAHNGSEAVTFLAKNTVDLVILDMIMEKGFDGLDTCREIQKIHPGLRTIITTGFSETNRITQALGFSGGQFLRKPFTPDALAKAVRRELDKKPQPIALS